jgi:putative transcriptional regulator
MTIEHHPEEALLAAHAAGDLDLGQRVALATHLRACPRCRAFAGAVECVGGDVMNECPPAEMASGALQRVLERLGEPISPARAPPRSETTDAPPGLPAFVRRYAFGEWRFVAPRVSMRPIRLPAPSPTRVFLLKSARNTKLLRHEHGAFEMTCVLEGGYARDGGHYGPGDFDFGDESISHEPHVDEDGDCVALVAMQGGLRWKGFWGLLARPFVRL